LMAMSLLERLAASDVVIKLEPLAMKLHVLHEKAYTWWKCLHCGLAFRERLTFQERRFLLWFRPALAGCSLVVYDIGAASGVVARCLAKLANVREIHAFEPLPSAFQELRRHLEPYSNVFAYNVALGDMDASQFMWVYPQCRDASSLLHMLPQNPPETVTQQVSVVTLDAFAKKHRLPSPDVVKIDVQGYEDRVIRGGRETIAKARYCIVELNLVQVYENSPLFSDVYAQLAELNFSLVAVGGAVTDCNGRQLQIDGIFARA